ncbi:MAG: D-glucuronyl C5-epimerase family protein [Solirubrobacteraceae bacterium]
MRRILAVLLAVAAFPAAAGAAPVLVLGRDGHATMRDDRYLAGSARTPAPAGRPPMLVTASLRRARSGGPTGGTGLGSSGTSAASTPTSGASGASGKSKPPVKPKPKPKPQPTVLSVLAGLERTQAIDAADDAADVADFNAALAEEKHLSAPRAAELEAVTETMHTIAAGGQLTASRLPALFATLDANRQWWASGPMLSYGQRVEFAGSQLVWEYYPGQGIQLQVLGSFSKADALYTAGPAQYPAMEQLLSELIPLAAQRGGGLAWEYYFSFDGGSPPWTSAMSQATGLEALSRAYQATGNAYYLQVAAQALALFTTAPPTGVDVATTLGSRYLQYTFAPQTAILNAFLQTLIGLDAYATVSGNAEAKLLFAAGNAEATAEVPQYDTGAWSLYQPGVEDDLSYHELVTGFLAQLCTLTAEPVYCTTAARFQADLTTPPALTQLTVNARAGHAFALRFTLSKISHVGIVVTRGTATAFQTSATFPYGTDSVTVPALKPAGVYGVRLAATDLAGNLGRITGTLTVAR